MSQCVPSVHRVTTYAVERQSTREYGLSKCHKGRRAAAPVPDGRAPLAARRPCLAAGALVTLLASCGHPSPPAAVPSAVPPASFVDRFYRPDTRIGLGDGWDLRGPYDGAYPLPPATDGFIRNGSFTYAGNGVVYAVRQFPGKVERMGTIGRWRTLVGGDSQGGSDTTLAMAISADNKLVSSMIHSTANRGVWRLTLRRGADFEPVADGKFSPVLALDTDYQFEVEVGEKSLTVRVPGGDEITTSADVADVTGDRAFWKEYVSPSPAGVVFDFDTVWAAVAGQQLMPIGGR